jgi:photosystem II stability/assembly factor-like uncharacterized protein
MARPGIFPSLVRAVLLLAAVAPAAASWSPLGGPGEPTVELRFDRARPGRLFAKADGHLWRSDDGGATWRSLQAGLGRAVSAFTLDPANARTLWAWTSDGELWRSRDAGETWSQRSTPPPQFLVRVVDLLVDPRDPETIYRVDEVVDQDFRSGEQVSVSRDGGASFQAGPFLPLANLFSSPRRNVFVHPERSELLLFGERGLSTSRDGGRSWRVRGRFHGAGFVYGRIAPSAPETLYALAVASGCPVRSDDAGEHWLRLACPRALGYNAGFPDLAVDPQDASHVWLVLDAEDRKFQHWLFESNDGGESWSAPLQIPESSVMPAGGAVLYTDTSIYDNIDPSHTGLSASRDGGHTWTSLVAGISAGDVYRAVVVQRSAAADDGWRLLALAPAVAGGTGLFRSNGGVNWVKVEPGRFSDIVATGGSTAVAVNDGDVDVSQDGGASWSPVSSAPTGSYVLVDANEPRYLAIHEFVANADYGDFVLWTSDDGGTTWSRSGDGRAPCRVWAGIGVCDYFSAYAVDPFDASRRYAALVPQNRPQAILVSTDAGLTWHSSEPGIPEHPTVFTLAADPSSPGRLLAGTYLGLFLSEDGGSHWRSWGDLPPGTAVLELARDARTATWYAATRSDGIYRSVDGGDHWTLLAGAPDLDQPTIATDPRTPDGLIAAFNGLGVWQWRP